MDCHSGQRKQWTLERTGKQQRLGFWRAPRSYPGVWSVAWSLRIRRLACTVSVREGKARWELAAEGPGHAMQWTDVGKGQRLIVGTGKAWAMAWTLSAQGPE